ncbi:hypothetical protein GPECTOR_78g78 [Gonium pectorale]|uniref:Protein kinase domain-containing protein n=1 Tax=Gonium pectorale TaxID=33097 RepID=A0A150G3K0_GONPE|nr:hypothetical protein GPECTOR_78g78 [Gonium pectorale]|eukprot:KXZ43890.1 hypothetical protein GPECTOR_78g78 [Gonium pectorale]
MNLISAKIQPAGGVSFTLENVVLSSYRRDQLVRAPGLDGLMPPPDGKKALIVLKQSALVVAACYPPSVGALNIASLPRPEGYPGTQNRTFGLPQPGCVDDPGAMLLQRCWPARNQDVDIVIKGADLDPRTQQPVANNYTLISAEVTYLCQRVLSMDCVEVYGPLGCYIKAVAEGRRRWRCCAAWPPTWSGGDAGGPEAGLGELQPGNKPESAACTSAEPCSGGRPGSTEQASVEGTGAGSCEPVGGAGGAGGNRGGTAGPELRKNSTSSQLPIMITTPTRADLDLGVVLLDDSGAAAAARGGSATERTGRVAMAGAAAAPGAAAAAAGLAPGACGQAALSGCGPADASDSGTAAEAEGCAQAPADNRVFLLPVKRGEGGFGQVHEGTYQGQRVAVKLVSDVHVCGPEGQPSEELLQSFAHEVQVLGRCQHPNVVRLMAACLAPPRLCLVMELMESSLDRLLHGGGGCGGGGRARRLLPLRKAGLTYPGARVAALYIAREIACGLEYLHPTIVHRDLKPANVLINEPDSDTPTVKLTDIFSFGVLLWELLSGQLPWEGAHMVAVACNVVMRGGRPPLEALSPARCPPRLRQLIRQCWEHDPLRRPAAAELAKELRLMLMQEASSHLPLESPPSAPSAAAPTAAARAEYASFNSNDAAALLPISGRDLSPGPMLPVYKLEFLDLRTPASAQHPHRQHQQQAFSSGDADGRRPMSVWPPMGPWPQRQHELRGQQGVGGSSFGTVSLLDVRELAIGGRGDVGGGDAGSPLVAGEAEAEAAAASAGPEGHLGSDWWIGVTDFNARSVASRAAAGPQSRSDGREAGGVGGLGGSGEAPPGAEQAGAPIHFAIQLGR